MCGQLYISVAVKEFVNVSDVQTVGDERVRPVICRKQSVHVVVEAFGAERVVSTLAYPV